MKWSSIKWILIALLIIVGVYLYYRYTTTEGFVTISNYQYPLKEVFLVAPSEVSENGNPVPIYSTPNTGQYNNQGYTLAEARKICQGYNGDLATLAQVQKAYDNSGNWCAAGWISGSDRAYYLPSKTYPCQLTASTVPTSVPSMVPAANNAFAICYAVKPPQPTSSVAPFNSSRYSMIDPSLLNKVINGDGSDIFPAPFTASQAYFALDNHGTTTNNYFDFKMAREWLIANYETLDNIILSSMGQPNDSANWNTLEKVNQQSCILVRAQDDIVSEKVKILQDTFKDISGYVIAAVKSKDENAKIQAMLYNICSKTTPADSPACAKLATLDFDLFYTNPTHSTLSDLEILNSQIYKRREEVCAILHNIRVIKSALRCPYEPKIAECSQGCARSGPYDCSNSTIFDINSVGGLRYSLEQMSPLFDIPAYNEILASVLTQLSYLVETPSLAQFDTSYENMKLIDIAIKEIKELIQNNNSVYSTS